MTKQEKREKAKEIAIQNHEFKNRLKPLRAKGYRTSLKYEDSVVADDGKAYVNVDLTRIDSPFAIYSYNKRMDPEIFDYIDRQVYYLRAAIPVVINFDDGGKYSEELKEKIKKNVRRHYSLEYEDKRIEHSKTSIFASFILLVGFIFLALHFIAMSGGFGGGSNDVVNEFTLIMSWMFIWQGMDMILISGHARRVDINNAGQLALAEVTFGPPHK